MNVVNSFVRQMLVRNLFGDYVTKSSHETLFFKLNSSILLLKSVQVYGPLAYFSDIFISGINVVFSEKTTFLPEMKISEKYASGP